MLGNGYEFNSMKYDVGALLCSTAFGNAGKWPRAQQRDVGALPLVLESSQVDVL